ncbi:hypothetical protein [Corynebacterium rouxii]|uniref:Uncharacterized protein n=1 Tax=Corynebacterium rouxii TaxID=2719119 RepID=A0A6I8M8K1_9CORY|nr:hypothetical protein [Corynebacterium rouxii]CAB0583437.1 hypothetical protein CIP107536_00239 [Corynebacterium diphtheriae]MDT9407934.1 hypothetical protein [Corynebacterium rouxii]MDT9410116.1 hypothetical protein [Corynebacterium rouxii]CAB0936081.1 hypothetical protein FRC0477_00147 [Corynebacterium diphtheriae]VZH84197.1 hypothetical protein FRC0190_00233 [Corynebacterium rouxii]
MSAIAVVIGAVGSLITAIGSLWIGYMKARSDVQAAKGSRMDKLEERIDKVQADYENERRLREEERDKRVEAETTVHRLRLVTITLIDHVEAMQKWMMGGAKPPPPTTPDLTEAKALI